LVIDEEDILAGFPGKLERNSGSHLQMITNGEEPHAGITTKVPDDAKYPT
jgi:hypothetical protein